MDTTLLEELRNTTVKNLARDIERPNLVALSYALRHPDTWPQDFVWNYNECDQCAMALACELWPNLEQPNESDFLKTKTWISRVFAMSYRTAENIFLKLHMKLSGNALDVTPDDVADAIDAYLKEPV